MEASGGYYPLNITSDTYQMSDFWKFMRLLRFFVMIITPIAAVQMKLRHALEIKDFERILS